MARKQYGVIPYLEEKGRKKMVLITSRVHGNWTLPKGGLMRKKSKRATAQLEALEEAGLIGDLDRDKAFKVTIIRNEEKISLTLYPMRIRECLEDWPEDNQRKRLFVPLKKAEYLIGCAGMKKAVRRWRKGLES